MMGTTLFLCFLVGISLGLLGGGGSVLTVPIFVYLGQMSAESAIAMSLIVVGLVSLVGAWRYGLQKCINKRLVLFFILSGVPTSFLGSQLTSRVSEESLLTLFGSLMCAIAVILFFKTPPGNDSDEPLVCRPGMFLSICVGCATGFLTGFLGVGGGFLIVPAIALLMRCSLHTAIGTSLAVIAVNSLAGFAGHLTKLQMDIPFLLGILAVMLPGTFLGSKFGISLKGAMLQRAFAFLILGTGLFVIYQNYSV